MSESQRNRWFTEELDRLLREIGRETPSPGTIVPDFEAHVAYFREHSVRPTGKTSLLPLAVVGELNKCLTRPIRHGLSRPVLKSTPHVGGLFMLARASGMIQIGSRGAEPVFEVDEGLWAEWQMLNSTERYCSLLETWVLRGTAAILGERDFYGDPYGGVLLNWAQFFERIPSGGLIFRDTEELDRLLRNIPGRYNLALLELFDLIDVEHLPPVEGQGWRVARITPTSLGVALLALLHDWVMGNLERILDHAEKGEPVPDALQPLLQPYLPDCRRTLTEPAEEPAQEGTYVFRVSLGSTWCRIAMPATLTLRDLADEIIDWIGFDHDHLFEFRYLDRYGVPTEVPGRFWNGYGIGDEGLEALSEEDENEGPVFDMGLDLGFEAHEVLIGELPLRSGAMMTFLYDFGDNWRFQIKLEAIDSDNRSKEAELLETHGEPPEQYGMWGGYDEELWGDEDDRDWEE